MHQSRTTASDGVVLTLAIPPELARVVPKAREWGEGRGDVVEFPSRRAEIPPENTRPRDDHPQGLLPWQVKRVRGYIDAALHERVSLSAAAGHARLSPGYFSRCFRRSFGVTFSRYVAGRRVERAQRLMLEGAGKLCQIAQVCGFADQAHFTRTFGNLTGCTPARWRRRALVKRRLAWIAKGVRAD